MASASERLITGTEVDGRRGALTFLGAATGGGGAGGVASFLTTGAFGF